jgi:ParB family chromosome partitioning protein
MSENPEPKKAKAKFSLGRGLSSILSDAEPADLPAPGGGSAGPSTQTEVSTALSIVNIPVANIEPNPFQPRIDFDPEQLQELADSIAVHGLVQPVTLRRLGGEHYQLIAGERRWRAAQLAGLTEIPAYIRLANDEQMLEMALVENVQRQDLNPIEMALSYRRLMDECSLIIEQVAEKIGKKRPTINNYLRLLKLPPDIQVALRDGRLSMGHARPLITVDNPDVQLDIFKAILEEGLSVRQVEERIQELGSKPRAETRKPANKLPDLYELQIREFQRNLATRFQTRVQIQANPEGRGEIKIQFFSNDDLNRLLELLA